MVLGIKIEWQANWVLTGQWGLQTIYAYLVTVVPAGNQLSILWYIRISLSGR